MNKKITVLGSGAFGTAVSILLAKNKHDVLLWSHEDAVVEEINKIHKNSSYLPGINLSENIVATRDLVYAIEASDFIFEAIPSEFVRSTLEPVKSSLTKNKKIAVLSKGIEPRTLFFPSQVIEDITKINSNIAVLSGPNFANEIAKEVKTATMVASNNKKLSKEISELLGNKDFIVFESTDVIGVQIGGAFKNILAICLGLADGAGLGQNTKAYLFTRGLEEIAEVANKLGAKTETIYGLSGLGDLILCCTSNSSRNFKFGSLFGKGKSIEDVSKIFPVLPEGVVALISIKELSVKLGLSLKFCIGIYDVIFNKKDIIKLIEEI